MSVTRTGTFKVRVISVFSSYMKPIYSFKKGNNYHRHWDIQSTDDQQILSLRGADLLIYREIIVKETGYSKSTWSALFSFSLALCGKLDRDQKMASWAWSVVRVDVQRDGAEIACWLPSTSMAGLPLPSKCQLFASAMLPASRTGTASVASCCPGFHRWAASLGPAHSSDVLLPSNRWLSFTSLKSFSPSFAYLCSYWLLIDL